MINVEDQEEGSTTNMLGKRPRKLSDFVDLSNGAGSGNDSGSFRNNSVSKREIKEEVKQR